MEGCCCLSLHWVRAADACARGQDSALHERDVAYPATYWLTHAQCVAALRCATRLFGRNGWAEAVYLRARRALRDYTERVLARIRAADGASSPTPVEYAADSKGAIEGMRCAAGLRSAHTYAPVQVD